MATSTPDFDQFIKDEIKKAVAANPDDPDGTKQPVPASTPIAFTVKGQDYKYDDNEALSEAVNFTVDTYQQQIADLQAKLDTQNELPPEPVAADDTPKFDSAEYISRMDKDPIDAANYLDSFRYGVADPVATFKQSAESSASNQRLLDVNQFRSSHPEFQASPQGAKIIQDIMQENGWSFSYKNLEASLAVAQQRGALPTSQQYQAYVQQQQQPQLAQDQFAAPPQPAFQPQPSQPPAATIPQFQNSQPWLTAPVAPPPGVGAPGGPSMALNNQLEQLSIEQLETILRNAGQDI